MTRTMFSSIILFLAMGLTACGGDGDEPASGGDVALKLSKQAIEAPADGLSTSFELTTTQDWAVYADDNCKEWVTLSPANGTSRSATVSVRIAKNTDYAARQGRIVAMSGTARAAIDVSQQAAERPATDPSIKGPEGYELVWNDEFDSGTTLGSSWTHEIWPAGRVNNELQAYVNGTSPRGDRVTEIADGTLRIHCFKEDGKIYSGRVYAKVRQGWKYGYFEAAIKLPKGKGTWPAFWMMPVNFTNWPGDGEIDIMEAVGYQPDRVWSTIHCNKYNNGGTATESRSTTLQNAYTAFHKYALLWTEDKMTFYVDGKELLTYRDDGTGRDAWPFTAAFYPILNLAWGGDWGGAQGVDESFLPATMEVDYVRVFQKRP